MIPSTRRGTPGSTRRSVPRVRPAKAICRVQRAGARFASELITSAFQTQTLFRPEAMIPRPSLSRSNGGSAWLAKPLRTRTPAHGTLEPPIASVAHRFSQSAMIRVTLSAASCWTKWPAFGIVTSVSSLSIQFQVSLSAPGSSAVILQAVDHQHRAFDLRELADGCLLVRLARVVGLVVVEHRLESRALERLDVVLPRLGVLHPEGEACSAVSLGGVGLLEVAGVLAGLLLVRGCWPARGTGPRDAAG